MRSERQLVRGDVVWVDFEPVLDSEQGGRRPAVVISPTMYNALSPVVTVAAVTSRKTDRVYPFESHVSSAGSGLSQPSKVMLNQIRTISVGRIGRTLGRLDASEMDRLGTALAYAVGHAPVE